MAGPTRAVGHPDYSSTSASGFIPSVWSGKMIEKLYARTAFAEVANTDYEGAIKAHGDSVQIRTTPSIVINDYEVGGGLTYEKPVSSKVELQIDQAKSFSFEVNNVDEHQADIKLMNNWSDDAGQQMKIAIDKNISAYAYTEVAAENAGAAAGVESGNINLGAAGAPVSITKANILDVLVDCGTVLDEQNVPDENRYIMLPAWMNGMLKKSDLRDASIMGDATSAFRNGKIGMLDRFTVYVNNNMSKVVDGTTAKQCTNIIFGHKKALTFASQMTEMDTLPNPNDFGQLVRGLNVFGRKVIDPNAIGHLYAQAG
ncbi:P22 phage major capsid protein family protein [Marinobacter sp. MDS2]|uniref:P22 phage major capsid protein family protein n=1 Tax=Marinobacter sp. MDS2 TaxID=3065961 RepID=UPI00273B146C|nr:P22 phage major capsid protein family protein [Marinobacter sp. MDS2]MDP4546489.1 P22 phage major capsid protein family protein [Marinobacter sp. MDS2]